MDNNLFASTDKELEKKNTPNYYDEVLEKRIRPELPHEELKTLNENKGREELEAAVLEKKRETLMKYTHEEVLVSATEYFKGDVLAANVWMNKYALKNSAGEIFELTPDDMHHRLASEIARIEKKISQPIE